MTNSKTEASLYIHKIMEERSIVVVSSAVHDASIMTAIVDIRDGEEVVFDYSGSGHLDRLIRQSASVDFSAHIDDTYLGFSSGAVEDTLHEGRPAFSIAMPRSIRRIQRRDSFRVAPPMPDRPECSIEYGGETHPATILDISIGGMRALVQNLGFMPDDVIERCRISTSTGIALEVSLQIVHVNRLDGGKHVQYGCMFKDAGALVESQLQKYVMLLQGRELAKRRGLEAL